MGFLNRGYAQTAPLFTTTVMQLDSIAHAGVTYSDTVQAYDADVGDSVIYTLLAAPATMSLDSFAGIIIWPVPLTDLGSHTVIISAKDTLGLADTLAFNVVVDSGWYKWVEDFDDGNAQGFSYSGGMWQVMGGGYGYLAQLDMSHTDTYIALYNRQFSAHNEVRVRLRLENNGSSGLMIGGAAHEAKGYQFVINNVDSSFACYDPDSSLIAIVSFSCELYQWYDMRIIIHNGVVEAALNDTIRFAHALPSATTGRIGVISGKDVRSQYDDLVVLEPFALPYRAPYFITHADSIVDTIYTGSPLTYTVHALDSNSTDSLVYGALPVSAGSLVVDPYNGTIVWVVDTVDTGAALLPITVTDQIGLADTLWIPIMVLLAPPSNYPPLFITDPDSLLLFIHQDSVYQDTVVAVDPDSNDHIYYSVGNGLPEHFKVDSLSGALYWEPTRGDTGFIPLSVIAHDDSGATDTITFSVFVLGRRPGWCRCSQDAPDVAWFRTYEGAGEGRGVRSLEAAEGFVLLQDMRGDSNIALVRTIAPNGEHVSALLLQQGVTPVSVHDMCDIGAGAFVVCADTGTSLQRGGVHYKIDSTGSTVWTHTTGNDIYYTALVESDTALIMGGERKTGFMSDALVAHLNSEGDTLWTATYGGIAIDAFTVLASGEQGLLAGGYTYSYGGGNADMWLVRIDDKGDTLWSRTYGASGNDRATAIMALPDSGWLVAGWTEVSGIADAWLLRITKQGDTLWTRTFGGTGDDRILSGVAVGQDGYMLTGRTYSSRTGSDDGWLLRVTPFGDTLWSCTAGGLKADMFTHTLPLSSGGFLVSGQTSSFSTTAHPAAWAMRFQSPPSVLFPSGVKLVLDSIAGAQGVLAEDVALYFTVTDSLGHSSRIGDFLYSIGDSFSWNTAGFTDITENEYLPPGSRRAVWLSDITLEQQFAAPLYIKFCVADSVEDAVWIAADSIPDSRANMAMALVDNRMYMVGGFKAGAVYSDRLDVYNPETDSWHTRSPLPIPLKQPAAVALDGKLYVFGGMNNSGISKRAFMYHPRIDRWEEIAPLPTPRFGLSAAAVEGKIYTFGGFNLRQDYVDAMESYDPITNTWEIETPLPTSRYNPGTATDGNLLYVFGGYNGLDGGMFPFILTYSPQDDVWDTVGVMRTPRHSAGVVMINGEFVVVGGYNKINGYLNVVEAFNPVTQTWRDMRSLAVPRSGPGVAALSGRLFVFGGMRALGERERSVVHYRVSRYSNYVMAGPLILNNVQDPVIFLTTPNSLADTLYEDSIYTETLYASSPVDGGQPRYRVLPPTPKGLTIDSLMGKTFWLPLQQDVGQHVVVYQAYDRRGAYTDTLYQLLTVLNVNDAPVIDSITCSLDTLLETDTTLLRGYFHDEDGDSLRTLWSEMGGADSLSQHHAYRYQPDKHDAGLHTFIVTVTDSSGALDRDTISIYVRDFMLPSTFWFEGVIPHPFTGSGTIVIHLAPDGDPTLDNYNELAEQIVQVRLVVYSSAGHLVRTLLKGDAHPGKYRLFFDGTNDRGEQLAVGTYFLRLETKRFKRMVKLLIVQ